MRAVLEERYHLFNGGLFIGRKGHLTGAKFSARQRHRPSAVARRGAEFSEGAPLELIVGAHGRGRERPGRGRGGSAATGAGASCFAQAPKLSHRRASMAPAVPDPLILRLDISCQVDDRVDLIPRHPADVALRIADEQESTVLILNLNECCWG